MNQNKYNSKDSSGYGSHEASGSDGSGSGFGLINIEDLYDIAKTAKENNNRDSRPQPAPATAAKSKPVDLDDESVDEDDLDDESDLSYEEGLVDGLELNDALTSPSEGDYILKRREDTRSRLAIIYTFMTFAVFIIAIAVAVLDGLVREVSIIENLSEIIPLFSGVFLGTLGFVLGYYFKKGEDDE